MQISNSFFPEDTKQKPNAAQHQHPPSAKKQKLFVAAPEDSTKDNKQFLAALQQPPKSIKPLVAKTTKASNKPLVAAPDQPPKDKDIKPFAAKTTKASYNKPPEAAPNQPPKDKNIPANKSLDPPTEWWRPSKLMSLFETKPK
jgi:hypothetical protein